MIMTTTHRDGTRSPDGVLSRGLPPYRLIVLPDRTGHLLHFPSFLRDLAGQLPDLHPDTLQSTLRATLPFSQSSIAMFGKQIPEPRLTARAADDPTMSYSYTGREHVVSSAMEGTPLATLRRAIEGVLAEVVVGAGRTDGETPAVVRFNHCLANLYRDGSDHMGMHSDDEKELGRSPMIASVSLGAERRFVLVRKKGRASYEWPRNRGSEPLQVGVPARTWREVAATDLATGPEGEDGDGLVKVEGDRCEMRLEHGSLVIMAGDMQLNWKHGLLKEPKGADERINLTFRLFKMPDQSGEGGNEKGKRFVSEVEAGCEMGEERRVVKKKRNK
ncbi:hypothetical protein HK101_000229 [Irineochytrium annulatum]|nr:hypothetical protein HK101_000229 [Irineochytrium annulatum]